MLKMDLLGLKTLTVIHDAVAMIAERHGVDARHGRARRFDDPAVYELLRAGPHGRRLPVRVAAGHRHAARHEVRPVRRPGGVATRCSAPGPLDAGMHTGLHPPQAGPGAGQLPAPLAPGDPGADLRRHHLPGTGDADRQRAGGLHPGRSRRAPEGGGQEGRGADPSRSWAGSSSGPWPWAIRAGWSEDLAAQIETFGRYGFNKSHSVAYSVLSYQTAWLKAHYPAEFMAALLSLGNRQHRQGGAVHQRGPGARPRGAAARRERIGVQVHRGRRPTRIRFGLGAMRNVGRRRHRVDHRRARQGAVHRSLADLVERIDLRLCNKRVLESLIAAGACDSLGGHRAQLAAGARRGAGGGAAAPAGAGGGPGLAVRRGRRRARRADADACPRCRAWTEAERLTREKEVLGFFISGHPLERFRAGGGAVRHPDHRDPGRVERAPGDDRRGRHRGEAADLQEDRQGVRAARAGGLPRHRGGDRLSRGLGQAQPGASGRDAAVLLTGGYSARDRGEDRAPFVVEAARPLDELARRARSALSLRWRRPDRADRRARSAPRRRSARRTRAPPRSILSGATATASAGRGSGPGALRVAADDDLAPRPARVSSGADAVHYVKAG